MRETKPTAAPTKVEDQDDSTSAAHDDPGSARRLTSHAGNEMERSDEAQRPHEAARSRRRANDPSVHLTGEQQAAENWENELPA